MAVLQYFAYKSVSLYKLYKENACTTVFLEYVIDENPDSG